MTSAFVSDGQLNLISLFGTFPQLSGKNGPRTFRSVIIQLADGGNQFFIHNKNRKLFPAHLGAAGRITLKQIFYILIRGKIRQLFYGCIRIIHASRFIIVNGMLDSGDPVIRPLYRYGIRQSIRQKQKTQLCDEENTGKQRRI